MLHWIRHPYFVFFLLVAYANQGILIQSSLFFFQAKHIPLESFVWTFSGLPLFFLVSTVKGFNPGKAKARSLLLISTGIELLALIGLGITYEQPDIFTMIFFWIFCFFGGFPTLFLLTRSLRTVPIHKGSRQAATTVTLWFLGQTLFGVSFFLSISFAFMASVFSTMVGAIGLFFLLREDASHPELTYTNASARELFSGEFLSTLVLLLTYGVILFSLTTLFSRTDLLSSLGFEGPLMLSLFLGICFTTVGAFFLLIFNFSFSLRTIYVLVYMIVSLSTLTLLLTNLEAIGVVYLIGTIAWPLLGVFVFTNIVSIYPRSQLIQVIALWWFVLTISFSSGIFLPLIVRTISDLLYLYLYVIIFSIFLLFYLNSVISPVRIYVLMFFTKGGIPVYTRGYLKVQEALLSGLLSSIVSMFHEVFESSSTLQSIDHGDKKILVVRGKVLFGALLVNHLDSRAMNRLQSVMELFEATFHVELKKEPIPLSAFNELPEILKEKLTLL